MAQVNLLIAEDKKQYIEEAVERFGNGCVVIFTRTKLADKMFAHISGPSVEDICRVCYLSGYFQALTVKV